MNREKLARAKKAERRREMEEGIPGDTAMSRVSPDNSTNSPLSVVKAWPM